MTLYTEKNTSLLYEVQLFTNYALVRPATPGMESAIRKLSLIEFGTEFEEFCGDHSQVREYIESCQIKPSQEEAE